MNDLQQATEIVRRRGMATPRTAIILGSGLGGLASEIEDPIAIRYAELPGFATSTASGHQGKLIGGKLDGVPVVVMAGRFHRYEGYDDAAVTFPLRLMAELGASRMIVSNAAGGLNPGYRVGDIVVLRDVIDWAKSPTRLGDDVTSAIDRVALASPISVVDEELLEAALQAARNADFTAHVGVYLATLGPTYETRAEYRMMRRFGIDVVGMSTAPEVRMARQLGMRVLALSMVSNVARPDIAVIANHEEVLAAGQAAAFKLRAIVAHVNQLPSP